MEALMTTAKENLIEHVTINFYITNAIVVFKTVCVYF